MDQFTWDIEPLSVEETTPQLCHILYSDDFKLVMGYLRKLMSLNEYSERALYITERAILMMASHYTAWQYRFNIIKLLNKDILKELEWCEDVLLNNVKNYQIWHYRQLLIEQYEIQGDKFDPALEYPLIEIMIAEDNKNYHVWSYKSWLTQRYDLYDDRELGFCDKMLKLDIRNNSAWNYRYLIFTHMKSDLQLELKYVENAIQLAPQNASPWNYLQGIYNYFKVDLLKLEPLVKQYAELSSDDVEMVIQSTYLFEILAKIYLLKDEPVKSKKIYELLGEKYDPIRINYWNHLISSI